MRLVHFADGTQPLTELSTPVCVIEFFTSDGLSTKIHANVDALGNPIGFHLTSRQPHDLDGADKLLPGIDAEKLLADKAYYTNEWVITPLLFAGKEPVIPPKCNRNQKRHYDDVLYKARSLIEDFFCKLKQFRAIATHYDKIACNFFAAIQLVVSIIWLN